MLIVCAVLFAALSARADDAFLVKPYLQLGDSPKLLSSEKLLLMWHTRDQDAEWSVEVKSNAGQWRRTPAPSISVVTAPPIETHRVYRAEIDNLTPGEEFAYRVLLAGRSVFEARAKARPPAGMPFRFAVFGDCAQITIGQRAVAYQTWKAKPDLVVIPGDIVYSRGRISEYRLKFFPVYNADDPAPAGGVPLLRSTLFAAAPGNHDVAGADFNRDPDGLAYFLYWSQPLNGPLETSGDPGSPIFKGNGEDFLKAALPRYPRMANFSFDYGSAHFTVIDSNKYARWTDQPLRKWLEDDLKAAKSSKWRFVVFHHPGFNSSKAHYGDQWMRLLAPLFEKSGVDVVFSGHVHNYQRSFPLEFRPQKPKKGELRWREKVAGKWTIDHQYDGEKKTRPKGVIYLVTGAGGAGLYNPEQHNDAKSRQPFTKKFISLTHSFTVVDLKDGELSLRQISANGEELDRFIITR